MATGAGASAEDGIAASGALAGGTTVDAEELGLSGEGALAGGELNGGAPAVTSGDAAATVDRGTGDTGSSTPAR